MMNPKANKNFAGLGGHISTYASAAAYMVGFKHFFKGEENGIEISFTVRTFSPGIYSRAFLEGRLTKEQLNHFREKRY